MVLKILSLVFVSLVLFFGYVSTRSGHFRYERSGVINASPERIYPYISDFKKARAWNPYEQKDPNMKRTYSGVDGHVGSIVEFDGNRDAGSGKLEIVGLVPNQSVEIKLTMTSPMSAENLVHYRLTPEGAGTRFSWAMEGDGGFLNKLVSVFINCEKMVAGDFEKGVMQLKTVVEGA
jgi:uncharacterized protein YndB with AHSA1/START domain